MMEAKVGNGDVAAKSLPLTTRCVNKSYGTVVALKDINIDVRRGEFMTLLGPFGSGTTTLLMVLAGFVRPQAGSVKFGDEEVIAKPPHEPGIGMMFQNYALFPHMSVATSIAYPLKIRGWSKERIDAAVDEVLATVQLSGYQSRRIGLTPTHTALALPFVMIVTTAGLASYDIYQEQAARSLGATRLYAFLTVTLPQIKFSVVSAMFFSFFASFDEVVVGMFISTGSGATLNQRMFNSLRDQLDPTIAAISTCLIAVSIVLIAISQIARSRPPK